MIRFFVNGFVKHKFTYQSGQFSGMGADAKNVAVTSIVPIPNREICRRGTRLTQKLSDKRQS